MKSILNRIHTSSEKERGEGKKRRYPGTERPLARKTFQSIQIKISKNHRFIWEQYVCTWVYASSVASNDNAVKIHRFLGDNGVYSRVQVSGNRRRDSKRIITISFPIQLSWDSNSFGTGLVTLKTLHCCYVY